MRRTKEAFIWIIKLLRKNNVPFLISGGFAARIYGAKRELADIDIGVNKKYFKLLTPKIKEYIKFGPKRYKDKNWDLEVITLVYQGQEIDLFDVSDSKIFDLKNKRWVKSDINISRFNLLRVYRKIVPVELKEDLIHYKKILGRRVDKLDIKELEKQKI